MYNATNKFITTICTAALAAVIAAISSCGGHSREEAAHQLYGNIEGLIDTHNYTGALDLLDTLDTRYADLTALRRQALRLRVRAIEGQALDSISEGDTRLCAAKMAVDSLKEGFRFVESPVGLEGYYVEKGASDKVLNSTGIQPRITEDGLFYIVANIQGRNIDLESIVFTDGAENAVSSPAPASRLVSVEGSELLSFKPEEVTPVALWLKDHPGASKYVLKGSRSSIDMKLTPELRHSIVATATYALAMQELKMASVKREKFERRLQIARDQLANMPAGTEETK